MEGYIVTELKRDSDMQEYECLVNKPKHYQLFPGMQAVDVIRRTLSMEEFVGYLKGNSLKYRLRAGKKGDATQDLAKAAWYEKELRELLEG